MLSVIMRLAVIIINIFIFNSIFIIALAANLNVIVSWEMLRVYIDRYIYIYIFLTINFLS